MIITCVDLESLILSVNLDNVSFSNAFSNLIYVFKCKGITILNK